MVVDDAPPLRFLLKNQREEAADGLGFLLQSPAASDESTVAAKGLNVDLTELDLPHLLALTLILLPVAIERGLPTSTLFVATEEGQLLVRRVLVFPVACHVAFEVAPVPRLRLIVQHLVDRLFRLLP